MPAFVLDTNFFIQAHRAYYPLDVVPGFWMKVQDLASRGLIISLDKVRNEIYKNKDGVSQWCQDNLDPNFFCDSSTIISDYTKVVQWANSRNKHYFPQALSEFLQADEADAWLVAYAINTGSEIITHETSNPNIRRKIKIPEACHPFGIQFHNTIEMFRILGETF
jgi:hypothetical protein